MGFILQYVLYYCAFIAGHDAACYPPLAETKALMRIAPDDCFYYAYWSGRGTPDAQNQNQTERLLAEPEVEGFLKAIVKSMTPANADGKDYAAFELVAMCYTKPKALFIERLHVAEGDKTPVAKAEAADSSPSDSAPAEVAPFPEGAVRPGFTGDPFADRRTREISELFRYQGALVVKLAEDAPKAAELLARVFKEDGRTVGTPRDIEGVRFSPWTKPKHDEIIAATYQGYLILAMGDAAARNVVLGLTEKREMPAWLANLRERAPVERLAVLSFVDVSRTVKFLSTFAVGEGAEPASPAFEQFIGLLGCKNLKSVATISGLDGEAMLSRSLFDFDGAPSGVFAAIPSKPLTVEDFRDIPVDAKRLGVGRVDLSQLVDEFGKCGDLYTALANSEVTAQIALAFRIVEAQMGINIATDLITPLGDRWAFYEFNKGEGVAVVPLRDTPRFRTTLDTLRVSLLDKESKGSTKQIIQGHEVVMSKDSEGCTCLFEDRFLAANNLKMLEQYLRHSKQAKSAAEKPEIAALLRRKTPPAVVGLDEAHTNFVETYLLARKVLTNVNGVLANGFGAGSIPSRHVLEKHLTPGIWMVTRTEQGIEVESRGTLPIVKLHLFAAFSGMAVPDLSGAKEAGDDSSMSIPGTVIPGAPIYNPIPGPVVGPE